MVQDARSHTKDLGPVGAILVGGDIAFKGHPDEYKTAAAWLRELADATRCSHNRIFVIPGNHDVDRNICRKNMPTRNAQHAIARATDTQRARELLTQIDDPATAQALMAPLAAYNEFAAHFNCQVYLPERLYWKQDIDIGQGVRLWLHGLTSTLLSGMDGANDVRGGIYLSPLQTVLNPADDCVNLVICHHPPDWFIDHDAIEDAINGRALIQLFGHTHRQRLNQSADYVRFSAGAVNPDPNELGWHPGYNLIQLTVTGSGATRALEVETHQLEWQTSPEQYKPVLSRQKAPVFVARLDIPGSETDPTHVLPADATASTLLTPASVVITQVAEEVEAIMSEEVTRDLISRFWNLTASQRREITLALGLIELDEVSIPEPERYGRALERAGKRSQLEALGKAVAKLEGNQ